MKKLSLIAQLFIFSTVLVQGQLDIDGKLILKDQKHAKGAHVQLIKNSKEVENTELKKNGNFGFTLEINNLYKLKFISDDYVSKTIEINTEVPPSRESKQFQPLYFEVEIFPDVPGSKLGDFKFPVGKIKYNKSLGEFDYDVSYARKIRTKVQDKEIRYAKALEKHKEQQKEENRQEKRAEYIEQQQASQQTLAEKEEEQKLLAEKRKEEELKKEQEKKKRLEELRKRQEQEAKERLAKEKAKEEAERIRQQKLKEKMAKEAIRKQDSIEQARLESCRNKNRS